MPVRCSFPVKVVLTPRESRLHSISLCDLLPDCRRPGWDGQAPPVTIRCGSRFMGQEEFQELASFLKRFGWRWRLLRGIEGLCLTAICALLLFALGPGVQQIRGFFPYAPIVYSVLTATVLLGVFGWTMLRFARRLSQERAALYIEQKQPKLRNNLINSLQLYPQIAEAKDAPGFSASMVLALLRSTRRQITTLQLDELVDTGPVKARLRLLAVLFVPALAMVLFNPSWVGETFSLLTRPLEHMPPSTTTIDVNPKGLRVVRH